MDNVKCTNVQHGEEMKNSRLKCGDALKILKRTTINE